MCVHICTLHSALLFVNESSSIVTDGLRDPSTLSFYAFNAHGSFINHAGTPDVANVFFAVPSVGSDIMVVTNRVVK